MQAGPGLNWGLQDFYFVKESNKLQSPKGQSFLRIFFFKYVKMMSLRLVL